MPSGVKAPSGTADSVSSSAAGLSEEASVSAWEVEGVWAAWLLSELLELLDALFAEGEGAGVVEGAAWVSPLEDWGAAEEAAWVCAGSS